MSEKLQKIGKFNFTDLFCMFFGDLAAYFLFYDWSELIVDSMHFIDRYWLHEIFPDSRKLLFDKL